MGNNEPGERRSNIERRQFSYSFYLPERRKCKDRRKNTSGQMDLEIQSEKHNEDLLVYNLQSKNHFISGMNDMTVSINNMITGKLK